MRRVLVTRPEPGASATAGRLREAGFDPIVLPLTEIAAIALGVVDAEGFDAVVVTSVNALRHAPEALLSRLRHLPCFTVGSETAENARIAGFVTVSSADGDAEALASLLIAQTHSGAKLAYLCGRVRREIFEARIAASGRAIEAIETYDTLPRRISVAAASDIIGGQPVGAALVYSASGAEALLPLLEMPVLEQATILCISQRVAEVFGNNRARMLVTQRPDEASLFDLLVRES